MNSTIQDAYVLLKKFFGYDNFRVGQEDIISNILSGRDVLGIMPTGAGKSICYQIPAMLFSGVTIVISPLISLMKDQVDSLNQVGIPATYINSTLSYNDYVQTIENISNNVYKIIYVAPERLDSESFLNLMQHIDISMFAIDEAHCVSRWGHDFRPSYTEIANVILNLNKRPIVCAFTATATETVKNDIISLLHLENPYILTTGFDRKNLYFGVDSPNNKKDYIKKYVLDHFDQSGIIYCLTRKTVDIIYDFLSDLGISVSKYHAGMSEKSRSLNQENFVYDKSLVMVATNAFGMGIDKSNIRYVIHYNMPRDLESYYQEAGRAGRDGDLSECILLFNRSDIVTNKFLIEQTASSSASNEYQKLNDMVDYCNTDKCLRRYILEYFGETPTFHECNNCSNCNSEVTTTDITIDSKKILSCIKRMRERFGIGLVTDVLKGSRSARIKTLHFDELSTYGIMSDYDKNTIKDLISFLVTEGYINSIGNQYPVLSLSDTAKDVLFGDKTVVIKRKIEKINDKKHIDVGFSELPYNKEFFNILRDFRMELSNKYHIPPFIIFTDVSLKQMATYFPLTEDEFLQIDGIGKYKLEQYGSDFLKLINEYFSMHEDCGKYPFPKKTSRRVNSENSEIFNNSESDIFDNNENSSSSTQSKSSSKSNSSIKKESEKKEDTRLVSYNLFINGNSIEEIAKIRGFTTQTIESHLLYCYEHDMNISLEEYINTSYKDLIFGAIDKIGSDKLKPIKEALPKDVTYFDIKYYLIQWNKQHK